jgi:tetratricopeptide (TPR) repeat protein
VASGKKRRDSSPKSPWTAQVVADIVADAQARAEAPSDEISDERWAFRMAAAVLSTFDPATLVPFPKDSAAKGGAFRQLVSEAVSAPGRGRVEWALSDDARFAALERLGNRATMQRALEVNRAALEEADDVQRLMSEYINGEIRPPESLSITELSCAFQASAWLSPFLPGLPAPDELRRRLEERRFFEPFRALANHRFAGRADELARLREYIGVLPPTRSRDKVSRTFRGWLGSPQQPALAVQGPGGIGKSTLIARFVLDHIEAERERRIPLVHLDFADPHLFADDWRTWSATALRQLSIQSGLAGIPSDRFEKDAAPLRERLSAVPLTTRSRPPEPAIAEALARLVMSVTPAKRVEDAPPFLLVFDSFEAVQERGEAAWRPLGRFLGWLQDKYPRLRVVVASRARVELDLNGRRAERLQLEEFDRDAAIAFLQHHGLDDRDVAADVFDELGGNPLTLRLAAAAIRESPGKDVPGVRTRGRFRFFALRDEVVQGQLFYRVLGHIRDDRVRAVASSVLVLRRITPEVIVEVLQTALGLDRDPAAAQRLFERMRTEASLVYDSGDGSLVHVPEVRRGVLRMIESNEKAKVNAIDDAAWHYYAGREGTPDIQNATVERAEEIYHRLRLGQEASEVEPRWLEGVEQYLGQALDELPPAAAAYLAAKLGREVAPELRRAASYAEWVSQTSKAVRELLAAGEPSAALERLNERKHEEENSEAALLEAWAFAQLERLDEALSAVDRGIAAASRRGDREEALSLFELGAEIAEQRGDVAMATAYLDHAIPHAEAARDHSRVLRLEVRRLRLTATTDDRQREASEVVRHFDAAPDAELSADIDLVRELAAELGPEQPALLARALRIAPLEAIGEPRRQELAGALAEVEDVAGDAGGALHDLWARMFALSHAKSDWSVVLERGQEERRLSDVMEGALALAPEVRRLRESIAGAMADTLAEPSSESDRPGRPLR